MKKNLVLLFGIVFILISCSETNLDGGTELVDKRIKGGINKTIDDLSQEEIKELRNNINLDNITNLFVGNIQNDDKLKNVSDSNNLILEEGNKFIENLKGANVLPLDYNYDGGISNSEYKKILKDTNTNSLRDFTLKLQIKDKLTGKPISEGLVFVNNINLGEFNDGQFQSDFKWPMGIELFNIVIRSPGYGDAFVTLNSINSNGGLLMAEVSLVESVVIKDLDISKSINFETDDVKFVAKRCSLVDKTGRCITGKVDVNVNYYDAEEVNNGEVNLNMKALTKEGELVELQSGGMAFIEFLKDSEILRLRDGETVSLTYNVSNETVENMSLNPSGMDLKNGYWWYDKVAGVWKETEAQYIVDSEAGTFTVITNNLY